MTGRNSGVVARIREVAPEIRWTHCSIHREALAVKMMPDELKSVLDSAVKTVNFIKVRPMNARLFHVLCEEMGSFSSLVVIKTKYRSRVEAEPNLRLKLTSIDPDIPDCVHRGKHTHHIKLIKEPLKLRNSKNCCQA
ncbi:hypothetical protein AAFF_G00069710 [Aldrovandia affinis]|uniref:Zinc finger BED domain-containing protein 5 n=1 Tax=Aldrovandia affinis TaxID=143900 RepID=A0AAD7R1S9_9TELE|nr:hypothetical protein AAFF_G00069710 [Aldrovandia affinis]